MTDAPSLTLLGALRGGGEESGCTQRETRALTFVPLHRGLGSRSLPLGSGAALSAHSSAPGAPRWPLPVMSRSLPDLPERLLPSGPCDLVRVRGAAPTGELPPRKSVRTRARSPPRRLAAPSRLGPCGGGRELDRDVPTP